VAYFGSTDGVVYKFDTVAADDGNAINCEAIQAWSNLGIAENKVISAASPVMEAAGAISVSTNIGYDFVEPTVSSPSTTGSGGTPWGSSWGSPWSQGPTIQSGWTMQIGHGEYVALKMGFARQGDTPRWLKTDFLVKPGGNL
jgi:hypothetical protein